MNRSTSSRTRARSGSASSRCAAKIQRRACSGSCSKPILGTVTPLLSPAIPCGQPTCQWIRAFDIMFRTHTPVPNGSQSSFLIILRARGAPPRSQRPQVPFCSCGPSGASGEASVQPIPCEDNSGPLGHDFSFPRFLCQQRLTTSEPPPLSRFQPRCRPPEMSQSGLEHAVGPIDVPLLVDQDRPRKPGLVEIGTDQWATLKRHDHKLHVERAERILDLLQTATGVGGRAVNPNGDGRPSATRIPRSPGVNGSGRGRLAVQTARRVGSLERSRSHHRKLRTGVHSGSQRPSSTTEPQAEVLAAAFIHDVCSS